jgi:predicted GIY-YIG superfamily endonuclease
MRPFDRDSILAHAPAAPGVYVIDADGLLYVGSSVDVRARLVEHLRTMIRGTHCNAMLRALFTERGTRAFSWCVVEIVQRQPTKKTMRDEIIRAEQRWIDEINPPLNIARKAGSLLGVSKSEKTRARMRAYQNSRPKSYVKRHAEGIARRGERWLRNVRLTCMLKRKPVVITCEDGQEYEVPSMSAAATSLGVHRTTVSHAMRRGHMCGGCRLRFADQERQ